MKAKSIIAGVEALTKKWARQRKAEERHASAIHRRRQVMIHTRKETVKDAARVVMEEAYLKVSAGGTLPAHARQIMYAARPFVQKRTGKLLDDKYFTQGLLPDYIEEQGVSWNVVYDARGHFQEPHTEEEVPLGTLHVRSYLGRVYSHKVEAPSFNFEEKRYPTLGPKNRFGAVAFFEKEGFWPLFEEVRLAERYDVAIMSTKGMSVTSARALIDSLGVPVLVFHDFDKSGFSIVGTMMRSTRRYSTSGANVIDAGMRFGDIGGLASEAANTAGRRQKVEANLRLNGATEAEIGFLLKYRVELNAFPSDELVAWIEKKFAEHGIKKIIPDDKILADAYQRASQYAVVQKAIDEKLTELRKTMTAATVPEDLHAAVEKKLKAKPTFTWDEAVIEIVEETRGDC
jgi:hypothetical protein